MGGVADTESVIADYILSDFLFSVVDSSCIMHLREDCACRG